MPLDNGHLVDHTIAQAMTDGLLTISDPEPLTPEQAAIQPASVDFHLADIVVLAKRRMRPIDPFNEADLADYVSDRIELSKLKRPFELNTGQFVLGSTRERYKLSPEITGRCEGKSSVGRLGIIVHTTAGFIDPGFEGHITLELRNLGNSPVILHPGMPIGQLTFIKHAAVTRPYGHPELNSKYQGQGVTVASRYHGNANGH